MDNIINNPNQIKPIPASQPSPGRTLGAAPVSSSPLVSPAEIDKNAPNASKLTTPPVNVSSGTQTPSAINIRKLNFEFFLFIFFVLINLLLVSFIILKLPSYEKLKTQTLLEKTYKEKGLTKEKLIKMNLISTAFADEKTVVQIISEINKAQYLFESYSFSFESDEPKNEGAFYLPFVIKVKGDKESLFYLIHKLTSSKNIIEITDLQTGYNDLESQKSTESIINARLYINDNYLK